MECYVDASYSVKGPQSNKSHSLTQLSVAGKVRNDKLGHQLLLLMGLSLDILPSFTHYTACYLHIALLYEQQNVTHYAAVVS